MSTSTFTSPTKVEVMFPTGYSDEQARRWPATYYLNGTNGDQTWFRTVYDGEAKTASYPSLIVAPAGHAGYWSDWYNNGNGGPPEYETFVIRQLIPLIDANFRTSSGRAHRGVLGESMGGYGTLMLAARHPDLFAAASSLSGAVDTNFAPGTAALTASPAFDLSPPDSIYGPRATEEVRWRGHNPTDLAANLRPVDLQLYTGNGVPDSREIGDVPALCAVESGIIEPETRNLHNALVGLGITHELKTYNWGCHTPSQIRQEITDSLPRFADLFARPDAAPASFDYSSIEPHFEVFGWSMQADPNRALEFLHLHDVSETGLRITGSGTTTVATPPLFQGFATVTVTVDGVATTVRPDQTGRISFTADLGPANRQQQYTASSDNDFHTAAITFTRE
ncbi:alpha/beta hydrolase [Saccharopolyspora tripterygii]